MNTETRVLRQELERQIARNNMDACKFCDNRDWCGWVCMGFILDDAKFEAEYLGYANEAKCDAKKTC